MENNESCGAGRSANSAYVLDNAGKEASGSTGSGSKSSPQRSADERSKPRIRNHVFPG